MYVYKSKVFRLHNSLCYFSHRWKRVLWIDFLWAEEVKGVEEVRRKLMRRVAVVDGRCRRRAGIFPLCARRENVGKGCSCTSRGRASASFGTGLTRQRRKDADCCSDTALFVLCSPQILMRKQIAVKLFLVLLAFTLFVGNSVHTHLAQSVLWGVVVYLNSFTRRENKTQNNIK